MLSTVTVTTQPATELAPLSTVKQHCRVDHNADDALLSTYFRAARIMAELYLGRALITQTLLWIVTPENPLHPKLTYLSGSLTIPRGPVQTIGTVTFNDNLGNSTVISPTALPIVPPATWTGYIADTAHARGRIQIGPDTLLTDGRTVRQAPLMNLQIAFTAGYGNAAANVPQPIIDAVLLTTAFLYEHRGDAGGEPPQAARWLMDAYRTVPL